MRRVHAALCRREAPVAFVDQRDVLETEVELWVDGAVRGALRKPGLVVPLDQVTAAYVRPYSSGAAAPAGTPRVFRLIAGFAEHDERFGSTALVEVRRAAAPSRDEAEQRVPAAVAPVRTTALLAVLAWGRAEARSANPLVDMSLMRLRGVWTANAAAMMLGVGMYASFLIIPELVQAPARLGYGFGPSVTGAGLFMLPTAAVQLLLGPASGLLHRRFSLRAQLIAGQLSCAAGFASLAMWHDAPWQVYAATSVLGVGFWLCLMALPNQVVAAVPAARTGSATAVNTVVRNAGGALGACATPRKNSR